MRRAFTMIELIFVIVIIGILAAVASPKLSATRDDAKISAIVSNAKVTLGDFKKYYTSQGSVVWGDANLTVGEVTDVPLGTDCSGATPSHSPITGGTPLVICDEMDGQACITITPSGSDVTIQADGGTVVCDGVLQSSAIHGIIGGTTTGSSKLHPLGGREIHR